MKVAILQLSDIHLKKGNNPILAKFPAIRGVIEAHSANLDACIVVFSGDIAFSGKQAEYAVADDLIKQLRGMFSEINMRLHLCFLPGNHDCDFEKADKARELVLQGLLAEGADNIDASIVESCVRVQNAFFDFLGRQNGSSSNMSCYDRLAYSSDFEVDGTRIRVNFFNTAWVSKKKDKQGEILLPVQRFDPTPCGYDAVISVFHHPYAWLSAENGRAFRRYVEENSDVILTGHEHEGVAYTKEAFTGENTTHLEGGVLQDSKYKDVSTFNLLLIDTTEKKFRVEQYEWKGDLYTRYLQSEWRPFIRGKLLLRNTFPISSSFLKDLSDPGAQFNHPRADRLILDDIFIAPDFRELLPPNVKRKAVRDLVPGVKVLAEMELDPLHLITGAEKAGKTTLAKQIYLSAHLRGIVPLYLSGREIRKTNIDKVEGYIEKGFGVQYSPEMFERFTQLPKPKKLLILDDFQVINLGANSKIRLLQILKRHFGGLVVFGDDVVRIQEISARKGREALFSGFKHYQILELGYVLREKLIERWLNIGRDEAVSIAEQQAELRETTRVIEVVLGKNLVPSYPIFVLVLLQQIAAHTPISTTSGSYGYFYEYLITEALATASAIKDVDLMYNYIAELAHQLFQKKEQSITESDFEKFHEYYNEKYQLSVQFDRIRGDLVRSGIFGINSERRLRFKYRYVYYYFVARYLSSTIREPETQRLTSEMAQRVHREEYANILIFLSYLSKDPVILETLLKSAAALFSDCVPCDLDRSVQFLNRLQTTIPELMLGSGDPRENRLRLLKKIDDAGERPPLSEEDESLDEEKDEATLNEFLKLNIAFKTIEILGQILRNYAGSMKGDQKFQLISDCFSLGLRTLSFVYDFIEKHLEGVIGFFLERLEPGDVEDLTVDGLLTEAKRYVFLITHWWAVLIIKRLSHSAGSAELEKTYADLLGVSPEVTAARLIDLAIKLDHFRQFPETEALSIAEDVKDNYFSSSVLRRLIATHFYMTYVNPSVRDRIVAKLNIPVSAGKILDQRTKKRARTRGAPALPDRVK